MATRELEADTRSSIQAFAGRAYADIAGLMNVSMCVLGDGLGLFKALAAGEALTASELASRARLQERYVREWLSAMTCAEYVRYDPATQRFSLSPAQKAVLADEGGPSFLGGYYQNFQAMENGLFSKVMRAFREGGGVPYSDYDSNFWEGLERASATSNNHALVQAVIPAMPDVEAVLTRGALVADLGCSRGGALIALARAFPASEFVGYDAFEPNILKAREIAKQAGLNHRLRFEHRDAAQGLQEKYDVLMSFDMLHHAADVLHMLRVIHRSLQPAGVYICSEGRCASRLEDNIGIDGAVLFASSVLVCVPQVLSEGKEAVGAGGLPEKRMRELCAQAGFRHVRLVPREGGPNNLYEIRA